MGNRLLTPAPIAAMMIAKRPMRGMSTAFELVRRASAPYQTPPEKNGGLAFGELRARQRDADPRTTGRFSDVAGWNDAASAREQHAQRQSVQLDVLLHCSQELSSARGRDSVLEQVVGHGMAFLPDTQRAMIYLFEPARQCLVRCAVAGFGPMPSSDMPIELGIIGQVFTSRQAAVTGDVSELARLCSRNSVGVSQPIVDIGEHAEMPSEAVVLPLVAQDQALGVLLLLRQTSACAVVTDDLTTLSGVATLAAAALLAEQHAGAAAHLGERLLHMEQHQQAMIARLTTAEAAMLHAARLAAVGQLTAAVTHEINNPLYAARNCLFLHEQDLPAELRDSEYLTIARDQLTRIAGIIVRMRDFYHPDRGEREPCDVNELLEETLELAQLTMRHAGITVVFTPAPDLPQVVGNSTQLRQVFLNLIMNAIDAMPQAGTLTVRTVGRTAMVVVEVQDSGGGIPPEIRARLFEPFFTSKPTGTGLGLAISAHIVTQHGGQIAVESAVGQGSTFRVTLPVQLSA